MIVYLDEVARRLVATRRDSTVFEALSRQQFAIVETLGTHGPLLFTHLARHVRLPVSTVSATATQLTSKRLTRRRPSAVDRRLIALELTPRGVELYRAVLEARVRVARQLLTALEIGERSQFLQLLRKAFMPH